MTWWLKYNSQSAYCKVGSDNYERRCAVTKLREWWWFNSGRTLLFFFFARASWAWPKFVCPASSMPHSRYVPYLIAKAEGDHSKLAHLVTAINNSFTIEVSMDSYINPTLCMIGCFGFGVSMGTLPWEDFKN